MEKKTRILALVVVLVFATATANAALTILDPASTTVNTNVVVDIVVYSDAKGQGDYGVYLANTSDYPANAKLETVVLYVEMGAARSFTGSDPGAGGDYHYGAPGSTTANANWSKVNFVGLQVGTYTVELTSGTGGGGSVLDSETITVVPEPATVALLGLGGLLVLIRRR